MKYVNHDDLPGVDPIENKVVPVHRAAQTAVFMAGQEWMGERAPRYPLAMLLDLVDERNCSSRISVRDPVSDASEIVASLVDDD
jgi:hypothetical protein